MSRRRQSRGLRVSGSGRPRYEQGIFARQELERTHVREAPLELSPSEAQVVQLAALGLKNREIAERLFLSPKTVEANLARAYRKLGVRSRAELGATMAQQVPGGSS
jgi:DNA-binding NarL/FixJ family response regulator